MPSPFIARIIAFGFAMLGMPVMAFPDQPINDLASIQTLKILLEEGIVQHASLSEISQTARQFRVRKGESPVPDYAHGLVLLSREEFARALDCIEAALERDPTYLPAWKARLRTRLMRQQTEIFKTECLKLAEVVGDDAVTWSDKDQRSEAAAWLGQTAGFLSLPDVELMKEQELTYFEWTLKLPMGNSQLGHDLKASYAAGRQSLLEDHQNLQEIIEQEIRDQWDQIEEELAELTDRKQDLDQRVDSLELMVEQLKIRLAERQRKADQQLKTLGQGYNDLNQAARGVVQLMQQTHVDVGRLHIELASRGILGAQAEQQPVMIQLRQEILKYQTQYRTLERRGAKVQTKGQRIIANRWAALRQYQRVRNNIRRQIHLVYRRQKTIEAASEKIQDEDQKVLEVSLQKQLADPANYFELDEQDELVHLIEQAGGSLETQWLSQSD